MRPTYRAAPPSLLAAGFGLSLVPGLVRQRLADDRLAAERPFSVIAHRPNYFLFAAWNAAGWSAEDYRAESGDPDHANDDLESQFQVSLKVPLAVGLLDGQLDIYGAYTNRSFWQVYNSEYSEPFRETNHEPEGGSSTPAGAFSG